MPANEAATEARRGSRFPSEWNDVLLRPYLFNLLALDELRDDEAPIVVEGNH